MIIFSVVVVALCLSVVIFSFFDIVLSLFVAVHIRSGKVGEHGLEQHVAAPTT